MLSAAKHPSTVQICDDVSKALQPVTVPSLKRSSPVSRRLRRLAVPIASLMPHNSVCPSFTRNAANPRGLGSIRFLSCERQPLRGRMVRASEEANPLRYLLRGNDPNPTYRLSAATCGGVREQTIRRFQALISATANERSAISFIENCSHACS